MYFRRPTFPQAPLSQVPVIHVLQAPKISPSPTKPRHHCNHSYLNAISCLSRCAWYDIHSSNQITAQCVNTRTPEIWFVGGARLSILTPLPLLFSCEISIPAVGFKHLHCLILHCSLTEFSRSTSEINRKTAPISHICCPLNHRVYPQLELANS